MSDDNRDDLEMSEHEQNTQRPSDVLRVCCVCKELGATVFHGFVSHRTEDWRHVDCIPAPAPQTEAADVEVNLAPVFNAVHQYWTIGAISNHVARSLTKEQIIKVIQRIAELQKQLKAEGELRERTADDLIRVMHRADTAEARVKELEQKLAGALKVTTENTIAHMQGKP